MERIAAAADTIAVARQNRSELAPLPDAIRPRDEAEAYRVQDAVHERLTARRVGYKIGCTTAVMQAFLRIGNPCAGGLFDRTVYERRATLPFDGFRHVGVECEIAVRIGRDLTSGPFTPERVGEAVAGYMTSIEIVDDRFADFRSMDTPTLIADDFFAWGCVLGEPVRADAEAIAAAIGTTAINGVEVGRGRGTDVLGHPLNALAWLARHLDERGRYLRAGEIVTTGSLVETKWLARGDRVTITVSGLGEAELQVI